MHSQNLQEYVDFLRRALPEEDRIALPDAALERVARHAMTVREATPWGRSIPEWIFRDYVLFPRVNDEFPEAWHAPIWESLRARLAGLSMTEAALEVNVWCAEHATYQSTDNRTAGPLTVLRRGCGRCGEESTLLTAALRAAGIPARQMYSPRWAHCDDNHAWVEAWLDGGWHYMGACEPEPEPDSGWFTAAASKAMLVHTRAFGEAPEGERVEREYGSFSIVNRTAAYARTRRVTVRVADGGCPLPGAAVRFELANMAELYPISEKITDARGEAELETGCGTLRIHATDGNRWLARTTDAERVEIDLKDGFSCEEKAAAEAPRMQKNRGKESDGTVCGGADVQAGGARERCAARSESEALREEAAGRGDEQNAPASRMASRERCAVRCEREALREETAGRGDEQNAPASRMASRECCTARCENEALREEAAGRGDEQNAPASRMALRERCTARSESEALRFADEKLRADVSSEALQKRDAAARENGDAAEDVLPPTERFVQRPPRETRIQPTVHSEAAARRHAETLRRCERMRAARSAELASDDADLARARGNAGEIRAFVSDARFAQADKRALLSTLREKDLADTSAETLMDALETALPVKTALPEAIWREAVLCPRIADEKLLPVRRALRQALGEGLCPSDEAARVDGESTAGIPAAREYAETAEAAALPGGADKASRCMGTAKTGENPASARSAASIPAAREYAETAEAAALPGGADEASRCMGAAKTGENPASARSAASIPAAREYAETAEAAALPGGADEASRCKGTAKTGENPASARSAASIPAAREYAETAEAAALPGGADEASRCKGAAKTGENPASGIPISGETEHRHGEAVQSRACAVEATPEAQCQHAARPEGCAGNEDSTGTLIADEATLECSETRETTQSRACAAERAVSEAPRLHVTLPEAIPEHGQASGAALEGLPTFTARAAELWRRIEARVRPVHSDFPLVPDLRAALRAGRAAPMVRDILFVAAARACGIPARLNPAGGEKEIWDGAWRPLLPMEKGRLRLTSPTGAPKVYGVDFTVGILENGAFRTLSFWGETLENLWEREVPAGVYRAVHCARQIDGSVDGELRYARVAPSGRAEIALEPLPDRTGEKLLRRRLPELRAEEILPEGAGAISSAMRRSEPRSEANHVESSLSMHAEGLRHEELSSPLRTAQPMRESEPSSPTRAEGRTHGKGARESSLTMRAAMAPGARQTLPKPGRASLLAVLDPGAEPTEHFLNEVLEIREEFKSIQLELLISRRSQCENVRLAETLRAVPHARLWMDFDADALLEWRKALGAGDLRLPLAVAFDAQGEALFAFTNYNVGSVRSLLRCIAAAD